MKIIEVSQFFIHLFYFLQKRVYTSFLNVALTLFVYMSVWSTGIHDRLKRLMKLKIFLLYIGFNKLQNNLLVPSYCPKIARTLRLVLSDNPTVMVLFMLLHICNLNYRTLSHHLYISKNKNKKTHCACKLSYRFHFDPIYEKWFNDHTRNNNYYVMCLECHEKQ